METSAVSKRHDADTARLDQVAGIVGAVIAHKAGLVVVKAHEDSIAALRHMQAADGFRRIGTTEFDDRQARIVTVKLVAVLAHARGIIAHSHDQHGNDRPHDKAHQITLFHSCAPT